MLFVLNTVGVPSVASFVHLGAESGADRHHHEPGNVTINPADRWFRCRQRSDDDQRVSRTFAGAAAEHASQRRPRDLFHTGTYASFRVHNGGAASTTRRAP